MMSSLPFGSAMTTNKNTPDPEGVARRCLCGRTAKPRASPTHLPTLALTRSGSRVCIFHVRDALSAGRYSGSPGVCSVVVASFVNYYSKSSAVVYRAAKSSRKVQSRKAMLCIASRLRENPARTFAPFPRRGTDARIRNRIKRFVHSRTDRASYAVAFRHERR
jgi:hypothetical protein